MLKVDANYVVDLCKLCMARISLQSSLFNAYLIQGWKSQIPWKYLTWADYQQPQFEADCLIIHSKEIIKSWGLIFLKTTVILIYEWHLLIEVKCEWRSFLSKTRHRIPIASRCNCKPWQGLSLLMIITYISFNSFRFMFNLRLPLLIIGASGSVNKIAYKIVSPQIISKKRFHARVTA